MRNLIYASGNWFFWLIEVIFFNFSNEKCERLEVVGALDRKNLTESYPWGKRPCVVRSLLLDTHNIFSCFIFLLFKDFWIVFSLFLNCKETDIFFRLLTYPLQVSSAIECPKVTLSEVYYVSHSVEKETVKSL